MWVASGPFWLTPLTHSLNHSLTHSLTNSRTHELTNSRTHELTNSRTHELTNSRTHPVTHELTQLLTNSRTHPLTHELGNSRTHSRTRSRTTNSRPLSVTPSVIHSLSGSLSQSLLLFRCVTFASCLLGFSPFLSPPGVLFFFCCSPLGSASPLLTVVALSHSRTHTLSLSLALSPCLFPFFYCFVFFLSFFLSFFLFCSFAPFVSCALGSGHFRKRNTSDVVRWRSLSQWLQEEDPPHGA